MDPGRHLVSESRPAFGGSGSTVLWGLGQGRQLPGSGNPALEQWGSQLSAGVAAVFARGVVRRQPAGRRSKIAGEPCVPQQTGTGFGTDGSSIELGRTGPAGRRRLLLWRLLRLSTAGAAAAAGLCRGGGTEDFGFH